MKGSCRQGEKCSHADLSDKIAAFGPDVVGVTSFTVSLIDVLMVAETAKRLNPKVFTVLGGHHPIAFPFEAVSLAAFDCIVCGEGKVARVFAFRVAVEQVLVGGLWIHGPEGHIAAGRPARGSGGFRRTCPREEEEKES